MSEATPEPDAPVDPDAEGTEDETTADDGEGAEDE